MKRPYFQFYPADWRNDSALRLCSIGARGLWVEMLCIMHTAEPYGHLVAAGRSIDAKQLGRLVGETEKDVKSWLDELTAQNVFSVTSDQIIYSRRMLRDETERDKWKERQDRHRNVTPNVTPSVTPNVTDGVTPMSPRSSSALAFASAFASTTPKDQEQKPKAKAAAAPLPDWLSPQAWQDFVDMRNRIRKPLTEKAIQLGIAELDELRLQGHDPVSLINKAVLKNWLSFYPPKENERRAGLTEAGSRTAANLERWEKSEQDKENAAD